MKLEQLAEYFRKNLYEMSTWRHTTTGLSHGTELWVRTEPNEHGHVKYRIKIDHPQKGSAIFAIWGDEAQQVDGVWKVTGSDLKKILTLVSLTQKDIINHIDGVIDSAELTDALRAVKSRVEQ